MPNKQVQLLVGTMSGAAAGYFVYPSQNLFDQALASLGGSVGGSLTVLLPDLIDPPTGPSHRGIGHSLLLNSGLIALGKDKLMNWVEGSYLKAKQAEDSGNDLLAALWHFLGGLLLGLAMGLISHLALDAVTPRSLPLIL